MGSLRHSPDLNFMNRPNNIGSLEYQISQVHLIFVSIEKAPLRIQRPLYRVSHKLGSFMLGLGTISNQPPFLVGIILCKGIVALTYILRGISFSINTRGLRANIAYWMLLLLVAFIECQSSVWKGDLYLFFLFPASFPHTAIFRKENFMSGGLIVEVWLLDERLVGLTLRRHTIVMWRAFLRQFVIWRMPIGQAWAISVSHSEKSYW
jgi:hypothetical protein